MLAFQTEQPTLRSHRASAPVHPSKKVIILGDSIVYGFGDGEGGGWVERLRRSSMEPGSTGPVVYNLGIRGVFIQESDVRIKKMARGRWGFPVSVW